MNWNRLFPLRPVIAAVGPGLAHADHTLPSRDEVSGSDLNHRDSSWGNHLSYLAALAHARQAMRRDDWNEAEAFLMRVGPVAGDDPAFCNLVGVMWEVKGNRRLAKVFYGRAIRANGRYPAAQQNMRRLYELATFGATQQPVALGDEPGKRT